MLAVDCDRCTRDCGWRYDGEGDRVWWWCRVVGVVADAGRLGVFGRVAFRRRPQHPPADLGMPGTDRIVPRGVFADDWKGECVRRCVVCWCLCRVRVILPAGDGVFWAS